MNSKLDLLMSKIEDIFLTNVSIEEDHNGQYIEHKNFLFEIKEFLKENFLLDKKDNDIIKRFSIREKFKKKDDNAYEITGISYEHDEDGQWVNYQDVINLIEDNKVAINKLNDVLSILKKEHRIKNEL
jgi:hypothetical protein